MFIKDLDCPHKTQRLRAFACPVARLQSTCRCVPCNLRISRFCGNKLKQQSVLGGCGGAQARPLQFVGSLACRVVGDNSKSSYMQPRFKANRDARIFSIFYPANLGRPETPTIRLHRGISSRDAASCPRQRCKKCGVAMSISF
jgi:hypothetical protein